MVTHTHTMHNMFAASRKCKLYNEICCTSPVMFVATSTTKNKENQCCNQCHIVVRSPCDLRPLQQLAWHGNSASRGDFPILGCLNLACNAHRSASSCVLFLDLLLELFILFLGLARSVSRLICAIF